MLVYSAFTTIVENTKVTMRLISIYYKVMRKINKLASKIQPPSQQPKGPNLLDQIGKSVLYGFALGLVF